MISLLPVTIEPDQFRVRDRVRIDLFSERRHGRAFGEIEDRVKRVKLEMIVMRRPGRRAWAEISRLSPAVLPFNAPRRNTFIFNEHR